MKTKVLAESITDAQETVKNKIIFHKTVIDEKDDFNQVIDIIDDIMDVLDNK